MRFKKSSWFGVALACGIFPSTVDAADVKLGNWNIQTLTYSGDTQTVFPGDYVRQPADFADLRTWRDRTGADIYFLQEVTSPAAINEVFPLADGWSSCISGQYSVDETLPAGPVCTKPGEAPSRPAGSERRQYTAVAWRSDRMNVGPVTDVETLNVRSVDNDGTIRDLRWGLDVSLSAGQARLRALVVHMKSGCFDDPLNFRLFTVDPATTPPERNACVTLARQMFPLHQWVKARQDAGDAWIVVGDFNRRLDAGAGTFQDEVWQAVSAYSPGFDGHDRDNRPDIDLYRAPYKTPSSCWADTLNPLPDTLQAADDYNMLPIEFFLFGKATRSRLDFRSEKQVAWMPSTAVDRIRLSDHCPSIISPATD